MPYIEGESLRHALEKGPLPVKEVVRILDDVVDALAYAHARGVIHRDIKPGNILRQGSHALVTDFGVAKALNASMPVSGITTAGMVIGKDSGIVVEGSYARAQRGEDPETYEQFSIGYTSGLNKLQGRLQYDPLSRVIKILPGVGSSIFPTPSLGLIARYLSNPLDYEISVDFGVGPIPHLHETKVGLMTSRLFALRARWEFFDSQFLKFGLARKELRGNFDLESGWNHLAVVNHGIEVIWEQRFSDWYLAWLGVYIPILFLPHQHRFLLRNFIWEPSDEFEKLARKWERQVSFSLLNVHKEF